MILGLDIPTPTEAAMTRLKAKKHYQVVLIRVPILTLSTQAFLNSFTNTMIVNILLLKSERF